MSIFHKKKALGVIFVGVFFAGFLSFFGMYEICGKVIPSFSKKDLSIIDDKKVESGYILYSPFAQAKFLKQPGYVYLVDNYGVPVNIWKTKYQVLYSMLTKEASLYVAMIEPSDPSTKPTGGGTGIIQELDWKGNILWEYKNKMLHHDIDVLPNGNIAALIWNKVPTAIAGKIIGGHKNQKGNSIVWSDSIIEIDKEGEITWQWNLYEHINISKYPIGPLTPVSDFAHANSIKFYETNPINGNPSYLISFRHLDKVFLIDRKTSKILWENPTGLFSYQHDATLLDNGNILVFDNGFNRKQDTPILVSSVKEINPKTNHVVWVFDGGSTGAEKAKFAASAMGGAQRLSNGNTLVTNSLSGEIFEVTKNKELVLDIVDFFGAPKTGVWTNNVIFKARKYLNSEINWPADIGPSNGNLGSKICKEVFY